MSDDWETPHDLFAKWNMLFLFTLDPCSTKDTAKCKKYYTVEDNGIFQSWKGERVFMNPPYSEIPTWVNKAVLEVEHNDCDLVFGLLPAWTDRIWFHELVYHRAKEIRFLQGRVKFLLNGESQGSPIFGSMVVIWENDKVFFVRQ